jgi:predicted RNA polymerase sigma factor
MTETPLVEHLFRRHAATMTAVLLRIFGSAHIDLVEDVVQDALVRALEVWPLSGVPSNPRAWLIQVAKHRALDAVRRQATFARGVESSLVAWDAENAGGGDDEAFRPLGCADDVVAMLFMCCHPDIALESRLALALKAVAGLGTAEIARALLAQEAAVAQRLVRAKRLIRERGIAADMPLGSELPRRLEAVLAVLYLWFNEGYLPLQGEALTRVDLCHEALRVAGLVAAHPRTATPASHALAALMSFHAARLPTRTGLEGGLLLLRDQDRSQWNGQLLNLGFAHLERCATGAQATRYQIEAGIAACHASAPNYELTDWSTIVALYDRLRDVADSPMVQLNRAVALSRVEGAAKGIELIQPLAGDPRLSRQRTVWAVLGELAFEAGRIADARRWWVHALEVECTDPERRFLEYRMAQAGAA